MTEVQASDSVQSVSFLRRHSQLLADSDGGAHSAVWQRLATLVGSPGYFVPSPHDRQLAVTVPVQCKNQDQVMTLSPRPLWASSSR